MLDLRRLGLYWHGCFFYMSYVRFVVSVLPTGPEYVLPKALCGSVAAAILTQIRKYAAAKGGKASIKYAHEEEKSLFDSAVLF